MGNKQYKKCPKCNKKGVYPIHQGVDSKGVYYRTKKKHRTVKTINKCKYCHHYIYKE